MGRIWTPNIDIEEGGWSYPQRSHRPGAVPKRPSSFSTTCPRLARQPQHRVHLPCWGLRATDLKPGRRVRPADRRDRRTMTGCDPGSTTTRCRHRAEPVRRPAALGQPFDRVRPTVARPADSSTIRDTVECIRLAAENPAHRGEVPGVQPDAEQMSVVDIAKGGRPSAPERRSVEHLEATRGSRRSRTTTNVNHTGLVNKLGLQPHLLSDTLLAPCTASPTGSSTGQTRPCCAPAWTGVRRHGEEILSSRCRGARVAGQPASTADVAARVDLPLCRAVRGSVSGGDGLEAVERRGDGLRQVCAMRLADPAFETRRASTTIPVWPPGSRPAPGRHAAQAVGEGGRKSDAILISFAFRSSALAWMRTVAVGSAPRCCPSAAAAASSAAETACMGVADSGAASRACTRCSCRKAEPAKQHLAFVGEVAEERPFAVKPGPLGRSRPQLSARSRAQTLELQRRSRSRPLASASHRPHGTSLVMSPDDIIC